MKLKTLRDALLEVRTVFKCAGDALGDFDRMIKKRLQDVRREEMSPEQTAELIAALDGMIEAAKVMDAAFQSMDRAYQLEKQKWQPPKDPTP